MSGRCVWFGVRGALWLARQHYEAAVAIHRVVGNHRVEGSVLGNLGLLHAEQGRVEFAEDVEP